MIKAYFIGGPDDLTIRALPEASPEIEIALPPKLTWMSGTPDQRYPMSEVAEVRRGRYRCLGRCRFIRDAYIYEYEGEVGT